MKTTKMLAVLGVITLVMMAFPATASAADGMDQVKEILGGLLEHGTLITFCAIALAILGGGVAIAMKRTGLAIGIIAGMIFIVVGIAVLKMTYEKMGWGDSIIEMEGN